jgi:hypothetical protein
VKKVKEVNGRSETPRPAQVNEVNEVKPARGALDTPRSGPGERSERSEGHAEKTVPHAPAPKPREPSWPPIPSRPRAPQQARAQRHGRPRPWRHHSPTDEARRHDTHGLLEVSRAKGERPDTRPPLLHTARFPRLTTGLVGHPPPLVSRDRRPRAR